MNEKSELNNKLCCKICNKNYKSKSSLCNHNKKFHYKKVTESNCLVMDNKIKVTESNCLVIDNIIINKSLQCKYCNKLFRYKQNKYEHEKKVCKNNKELEIEKIKLDQINAEKEKIKEHNETLRLKIKLQNCKKLDDKTFKAVNKYLMDRSFKNNNINSNNNNIINNYQIFSLGNEQLVDKLTITEKKQIMNAQLCSLEKIVEIAHCGNYPQFKNIVITNLKDNFAYKYDEYKRYFVTVTKNDVLTDLIGDRTMDIEAIYNELSSANKIDEKTKTLIQNFLDKIQSDDVSYYDEDIKYENYKSYKINNMKILLYNNHDKITKDIALLFTNETTS